MIWKYIKTCIIRGCRNEVDFQGHHLHSRGAGGSDGPWNRLKVCRVHHNEIEEVGPTEFIKRHPETKKIIEQGERIERIWQLEQSGRLKNPSRKEQDILRYIRKMRKFFKRESPSK
jgi:hypothetical protein